MKILTGVVGTTLAGWLAVSGPVHAQAVLPTASHDAAIPTLETVAGHVPGAQITRPDMLVRYFEALAAAAPDRMRLVQYATSWEGRPLIYAIIASPANLARIDAIKADLQRLGSGVPAAEANAIISRTMPVTWLSYGVHGDEISSSDAALAVAYHLLAAEGDSTVDTILANSIVIIDPSQNPDGRNRFTNSYYAQLGIAPSASRDNAGADQPWPGGRYNHYLFDLNRDWFALTQPESRGRVAAIQQWHPVVLVDAHEMGGNETYFFPPSAEPFSPWITASQRQRQDVIGRANAAALDALGAPYFTREVFDAFYPGYGDTWPTLNGTLAFTYEQGSARGHAWQRPDGSVLTYAEGVRNHVATSLATALTVAQNARQFLSDYADHRRTAASGATGNSYHVIDLAQRRWNAESLGRRLAEQGIAVTRVAGPATACGRSYPAGYFAISQRQPAGRLVRSLLDPQVDLPAAFLAEQEARRDGDLPHELYDTTAWSVGLMSGLGLGTCGTVAAGEPVHHTDPVPSLAQTSGAFGLVVPWTDSGQAQLVARAVQSGLRGRSTDEAFTIDGRTYPRGSVVFSLAENNGSLDGLTALAMQIGAQTAPLASGWVDSGPNLGSDHFAVLTPPRVAILWDEGISPLSAGATRYVIEQRLGIPVTPLRTTRVGSADLSAFDVVIAADGDPTGTMGAGGRAAISRFVESGGVFVAYGETLASFSDGAGALFSTRRETVLGGEPAKDDDDRPDTAPGTALADDAAYRAAIADRTRSPDSLPGALLNTRVDSASFLSAGYDQASPVVVADGSLVLTPLSLGDGTNVVRFAAAGDLVASGHVWEENRAQLAFKPYLMAQAHGDGMAIGFVHDPAVRGYLDGLDLLLANAVLIAPARMR